MNDDIGSSVLRADIGNTAGVAAAGIPAGSAIEVLFSQPFSDFEV